MESQVHKGPLLARQRQMDRARRERRRREQRERTRHRQSEFAFRIKVGRYYQDFTGRVVWVRAASENLDKAMRQW